jgi:serine/threonine protein kinase/tetratricopeptide (TPR) repeat protein
MRERAIFMAALDLETASSQEDFIERECGGDETLKARVEALLQSHRMAGSFLHDEPLVGQPSVPVEGTPQAEGPGTIIGSYKLLERIGEGGFGVVYMAEQLMPVRRKVALKIVKPGMDTRQVIARFEAERQALAIMDHANIAKVLDGGVSPSGRPYFVMDLIKGVPITEFCDQNQLSARRRLELFVTVCHAVQHAHQKGIIHRDLKPSNVLITQHDTLPVVKIIDFGVAKALGQVLTEKTLFTGFAQMLGTPLYMSPEQAGQSGLDVDTRSDIYSLGVLLYELLTGTTPFDGERFKTAAFDEIRRIIREEEPLKPSSRVSATRETPKSISAQRQTELAKLTKLLKGDIDWIVMKALEKDRTRRYETANAFAEDLEHYLSGDPVMARPPSTIYRVRKFARRHQGWLFAAGVIGLACFVVVGSFGWMLRDRESRRSAANRELELATQEAGEARTRALLAVTNPGDWERTLGEAFAAFKRAEVIASQNRPVVNSAMFTRMAAMRDTLADDLKDRRFAELVDEIRLGVSDTYIDKGEFAAFNQQDAFPKLRDAIEKYFGLEFAKAGKDQVIPLIEKRPQPIQEILINALSECRRVAPGAERPAIAWLTSVIDAAETDPWQERARSAIAARDWIGLERMLTGEQAADRSAARLLRLVALVPAKESEARINLLRRIHIAHQDDFWATYALGHGIHERFEWVEALRYLTAAAALRPRSAGVQFQLGIALRDNGRYDEAIARHREALRLNPKNAMCRRELALVQKMKGNLDEAITEYREAIRLNPASFNAHSNLSSVFEQQGRLVEAEAEVREAIRLKPAWASHLGQLGSVLLRQGRHAEAETELREALKLHPALAEYRFNLINALLAQGKTAEAKSLCVDCSELKGNSFQSYLDIALLALCSPDEAKRNAITAAYNARKSIEISPSFARAWRALGWAHLCMGQYHEAIEALEKSCAVQDGGKGDAGEWIVLALAHGKLALNPGNDDRSLQQHGTEFRRYYQQASKEIDQWWRARPSHMVDQRIWDFRQEATEMLRIMEEKKQQSTDQEPMTKPLCM